MTTSLMLGMVSDANGLHLRLDDQQTTAEVTIAEETIVEGTIAEGTIAEVTIAEVTIAEVMTAEMTVSSDDCRSACDQCSNPYELETSSCRLDASAKGYPKFYKTMMREICDNETMPPRPPARLPVWASGNLEIQESGLQESKKVKK